ncbi:hypothetical protein C1T31_07435 [Hanstruepera neustonica]|uniref:Uncharacterized protein n=1 Tax=Hanstruepera neustonica TaxID=1445657 RepID=A0A2K1DZ87_9FLAO|nr:hypothetical protein [Hanstruepera neustonica]PNQ73342.1 hypothetical protein C1T31_07435 [Hanstruepera neustonica]
MNLKLSFFVTLILSLVAIVSWECYWRYQGLEPNIDDNKNLWANQRAKLENFQANTAIFIGSSRILYDIQLDVWETDTNTKPIMLAVQGASPIPVFKDIVEKTNYNGLLVVGVTPGLFFSTLFPEASPIKRPQSLVDYYYNRTYAQRLNHKLSVPLQKHLAFYRDGDESWDSDVDLKTLLNKIQLKERSEPFYPPFNNFEEITLERHMKMPERMITDTAYANTVKEVWKTLLGGDFPPPEREATTNAFVELAKKFKDKGGQLVLVRCPSSGLFKEAESKGFSRDLFWDELVKKADVKSYHYMDYEQFGNLNLPEWSHLSTEDARFFTAELIKIMKEDGISFNSKTN